MQLDSIMFNSIDYIEQLLKYFDYLVDYAINSDCISCQFQVKL